MKKFVYQFWSIVLVVLLIIMGYNYMTDKSGLFNQDFSRPRPEPNQHFVKLRYILDNKNKYNAYCFGSSRVGNIDLTMIKNGKKYYNMTYSQGLPQEWAEDIKLMLRNHVSISQIILGIDDFSFRVDPREHEKQYLRIPYRESNWKTYLTFLLKRPSKPMIADETDSIFDIYNSGRPLHAQVDEKIESDVDTHMRSPRFNEVSYYKKTYIPETMLAIKEIKEMAVSNGIDLIVFINPIHQATYLANDINEFNSFKRELAGVTNYYDFSGLNQITTNNYNYYETSHYRPLVGDLIIRRIFETPSNSESPFGVYVTASTIENHIFNLEKEVNTETGKNI